MEKNDIILQLKNDFGYTIKSFVSREVYIARGENGWDLFSPNLLETFLVLCQNTNKKLVINDWFLYNDNVYGNKNVFKYRGFRDVNEEPGSPAGSQHRCGCALDFHAVGQNPNDSRSWIRSIAIKLPYNIRMEKDVNWVHIDIGTSIKTKNVSNSDKSGRKSIDGGLDYVKKIFTNLRDNFGFKEIVIEN